MRLVVVTGMSGSGKRTAMKMLEDVGYFCVDNLPVVLIENFVDLVAGKSSELSKVALGVDARADQSFEETTAVLKRLKDNGFHLEILFLETSDEVLLRRYKETRRVHPLAPDNGRVQDGIDRERKVLEEVKSFSDYIIDTSNLLTRELKAEIDRIFVENKEYNNLMINIISFGYKHGIPQDADLVFDVRFLPNPFYVEHLKTLTGMDEAVQDYVMGYKEADDFLNILQNMLRFLIPNYIKEGKYKLVIAIGCTGGQHRSVTLADQLYKRMSSEGNYGVTLTHRDVQKNKNM